MTDAVKTPDQEVKEVKTDGEAEAKPQETVPLSVFLALKDDVKGLKAELKEAKASKSETKEVSDLGVKDLAEKYGVNEAFIDDVMKASTTKAMKEIEAKYTPLIQKQELEAKQVKFDQSFNEIFAKTVATMPDLPSGIDREMIKGLALLPQYKDVKLPELLEKLYGVKGKATVENNVRSGTGSEDIVDFSKMTPGQNKEVKADPKTRKAYYDWLDKQPNR